MMMETAAVTTSRKGAPMLKIALVNMPFAAVEFPSIALTQLQAAVVRRCGGRAEVAICYPSHDVCGHLGLDLYRRICDEAAFSGLGDWLFRDLAFPGLPDNSAEYRLRYYPSRHLSATFDEMLAARAGLDRLLDEIVERYRLDEADLVGFTSMFSQNAASFAMARRLKEMKPGLATAMGGANCESPMGEEIAVQVPAIDYVFSGPALITFPRLVEALLDGDPGRAERLGGVFTHGKLMSAAAGTPTAAAAGHAAMFGEELPIDEEVPLDYDPFLAGFERAFAGLPVEPILLFETSRGCWWGERAHCTFCGLNGSTMAYRAMAPEKATALIRSLFAYHPRVTQLSCVDNIMPREYPRTVFAKLEPPPGFAIFYEVKADVPEEDLALLSAAGIDSVQPGIEALATSTLTLMRKGTTASKNVEFLMHCLTHDVQPAWNLLVGFPGETEEVYRRYLDDIPRLLHLPPPSGVFPVRFDRFSPYFTQAESYGLKLQPLDFYPKIYPFPPASLANFAYYFADKNLAAPYFLAVARWIDKLRRAVTAWATPWAGSEPPVLCFERPGGTTIRDTRSGREVIHDVGEAGRRVLAALVRPVAAAELAALTAGQPALDLPAELARLDERGLIFEDRQKLMSLVFPRLPRAPRVLARYRRPSPPAAEPASGPAPERAAAPARAGEAR
jgi:ribosomal peptide maturation radical SAM protein 1